ncbi:MAG: peptidoglycan editing factor PgeF [Candidatus Jettenia sp. CY-1]|nr:MAG: peptidoglycan editing factor PgeF [Candidatus Jettenia sp. CY-1]
MIKKRIHSLPLWFFQNLIRYKEIHHFVSSRIGGFSNPPYNSLNLGFHVGDNPKVILKNREKLALVLGIPLSNFTTAKQTHDCNVEIVTEGLRGSGTLNYNTAINATDAMVTNIPNICLMVLQADCVPILFFDLKKKVIGIAHAGWRGTVRMVAKNTVSTLKEKFQCSVNDIFVGIGPSIGPCCYEVNLKTLTPDGKTFDTKSEYIDNHSSGNKGYFNLWRANKIQLIQTGIPEKNIETAEICTHCNHDTFFSYRYEKRETGRFGAGIMLSNL